MKHYFYLFIFFLSLGITSCSTSHNSKSQTTKSSFTVMFYNVENLFDTIDTKDVHDTEFTPEGEKHWNTKRYNKKLNDLSGVISKIESNNLPSIVGLCEVENKTVISDLIATPKLKVGDYGIVHEDSPDGRGIDVGLIYKKADFKYKNHESMKVTIPGEPDYKSRDVLYVKGTAQGETLHIFVNHWKSRRGGKAETEFKRVASANVVRTKIDEIQAKNKDAKIIVMGDLNDTPENKSVKETLRAGNDLKTTKEGDLFNLMYAKALDKKGTNSYKGEWFMLDNLIVSQQLMKDNSGWRVDENGGQIYDDKSIMYHNKKSNSYSPNKTYGGPKYYGGIRDHLAIYFILKK